MKTSNYWLLQANFWKKALSQNILGIRRSLLMMIIKMSYCTCMQLSSVFVCYICVADRKDFPKICNSVYTSARVIVMLMRFLNKLYFVCRPILFRKGQRLYWSVRRRHLFFGVITLKTAVTPSFLSPKILFVSSLTSWLGLVLLRTCS